jgi:RES domain-containing protein
MAYTSSTTTLAMLEFLAHIDPSDFDVASPPDLVVVTAEIEDNDAIPLAAVGAALPRDWRSVPAPAALAEIGDAWIASGRSVGLVVPSAILPVMVPERNVLINPLHPQFTAVTWRIDHFSYDPRLIV